jgi:2-oxopent-4-enoate/cis-2-oxohex-4-enoate hydratase
MAPERIQHYGDQLYAAWLAGMTVAPLRECEPDISLDDAYRIQQRFVERRVTAGETIVGKKIGVTSKPVQDFLGVFQPDFGQLTSGMIYRDGEIIEPLGRFRASPIGAAWKENEIYITARYKF